MHQDVHLNACARNLQWRQSQNPNWKLAQCLSTVKQTKCLHNTTVNNLSTRAKHKWWPINTSLTKKVRQDIIWFYFTPSSKQANRLTFFKNQIISPIRKQKNTLSLWMRAGHTPICTKCSTHYISICDRQWDKHSHMYIMLQPKSFEAGYIKEVGKASPKQFSLYSHSLKFRVLKYQDHKLWNKTNRILT